MKIATDREWVLVRYDGLWLLGIPSPHWDALSPVFELCVQAREVKPGQIQVVDMAQPLLLAPSMTEEYPIRGAVQYWPVRGHSREKSLREAIARAEEMVRSMRAQEAGIVLAREMPRAGMQ